MPHQQVMHFPFTTSNGLNMAKPANTPEC